MRIISVTNSVFLSSATQEELVRPLLAQAGPRHSNRERWVQCTPRCCRLYIMLYVYIVKVPAIVIRLPKNGIRELRNAKDADDV